MGFKTGALLGFAAGYYLGTKAGRERYEQINNWIQQARDSDAVARATERAQDLLDDGDEGLAANAPNN